MIIFQQSQALTSHFESFWSIMLCRYFLKFKSKYINYDFVKIVLIFLFSWYYCGILIIAPRNPHAFHSRKILLGWKLVLQIDQIRSNVRAIFMVSFSIFYVKLIVVFCICLISCHNSFTWHFLWHNESMNYVCSSYRV